jgi:nucleoside recognition membrane protein YjiH
VKAEIERGTLTAISLLKLMVPSLVGIGLFLTPIRYQGNATVALGVLVGEAQTAIGPSMKYATTAIFVSSAATTLLFTVESDRWTSSSR